MTSEFCFAHLTDGMKYLKDFVKDDSGEILRLDYQEMQLKRQSELL